MPPSANGRPGCIAGQGTGFVSGHRIGGKENMEHTQETASVLQVREGGHYSYFVHRTLDHGYHGHDMV